MKHAADSARTGGTGGGTGESISSFFPSSLSFSHSLSLSCARARAVSLGSASFSLALRQLRQLILFSSGSLLSPRRSNSIKSRVSAFLSFHLYLPSCDRLSFSAHTWRFLGIYIYITFIFLFNLGFNCIKLGPFSLSLRGSHYALFPCSLPR